MTQVFTSDPFVGNIDPGEQAGIKLFTLATAECDKNEKLVISQDKVTDIMSAFRQDSNSFGWEILVNQILNTAGENCRILDNYDTVTLDEVKAQAAKTFSYFGFAPGDALPNPMTQIALDPANNDDHLQMIFNANLVLV